MEIYSVFTIDAIKGVNDRTYWTVKTKRDRYSLLNLICRRFLFFVHLTLEYNWQSLQVKWFFGWSVIKSLFWKVVCKFDKFVPKVTIISLCPNISDFILYRVKKTAYFQACWKTVWNWSIRELRASLRFWYYELHITKWELQMIFQSNVKSFKPKFTHIGRRMWFV